MTFIKQHKFQFSSLQNGQSIKTCSKPYLDIVQTLFRILSRHLQYCFCCQWPNLDIAQSLLRYLLMMFKHDVLHVQDPISTSLTTIDSLCQFHFVNHQFIKQTRHYSQHQHWSPTRKNKHDLNPFWCSSTPFDNLWASTQCYVWLVWTNNQQVQE